MTCLVAVTLGLGYSMTSLSQKNGNQPSLSFVTRISAICSFIYISSHLRINKMMKEKLDPRYYTLILGQQDILTLTC